jgi:hypothetical protein
MRESETNPESSPYLSPETLALAALGWIVGDAARAQRLLALTGLAPAELRARAEEPALLVAVIAFLEAYEPDLVACAETLDVTPAALVDARRMLENA